MLFPPPTILQQANIIGLQCRTFTDPRGGTVKLLENMRKLWEEIYIASDSPRILICFNGEQARGAFSVSNTLHRVDRSWIVVIIKGKGFNAVEDSGKGAGSQVVGVAEPFLTSIEKLRETLRVLINISEEFPIDYKSIKPLPGIAPGNTANVFIDGYAIEFSTANDIPDIVTELPG